MVVSPPSVERHRLTRDDHNDVARSIQIGRSRRLVGYVAISPRVDIGPNENKRIPVSAVFDREDNLQ